MTSDTIIRPNSDPATVTAMRQESPQRVSILNVGFHAFSFTEALERVEAFIRDRTPRQVCMANAYTIGLAQSDPELLKILQRSALVLADGMSVVWGARWVNLRLPGRIAGPDFMSDLCRVSADKGYRVFLMGNTKETLRKLQQVLTQRWPTLQIVGMHSPPFMERLTEPENRPIFKALEDAKPDILFVSMSTPKQEKWIGEHLHRLSIPVCIGVGAAFDFISGKIPRAPDFFQRHGLEWLYRLGCEPRRLWKRYLLGNLIFLSRLARQSLGLKFRV